MNSSAPSTSGSEKKKQRVNETQRRRQEEEELQEQKKEKEKVLFELEYQNKRNENFGKKLHQQIHKQPSFMAQADVRDMLNKSKEVENLWKKNKNH